MPEEKKYYINSTKYSIQERDSKKNGRLYDVYFRIVDMDTLKDHAKKLSGFKTKTAAKNAHADFVTKYCDLLPQSKKRELKQAVEREQLPSLGALVDLYINSVGNSNKDATLYEKRHLYQRYLINDIGSDTDVSQLTKQDFFDWQERLWVTKNERTGEYYSYAYLTKIRALANSFWQWVQHKYNVPNLLSKIPKPRMSADQRAQKKEMEIWEPWEFEKFIEVVDDPMYATLFTVLYYTGRRSGEVFALSPEDVLYKKCQIRFNSSITRKVEGAAYKLTSTKTGKKQMVDVSPKVIDALKAYQPQSPFLFGGSRPLADKTVRARFYRYAEKAGVKKIRIHDLRHSFVSLCIHHMANLKVVAELIGDTLEQVTKTYAHLYNTDTKNVVNSL